VTKCRYCPAEIMWAVTENGIRIPLDPSPSPKGNVMLEFQADGTPIATVVDPSKAVGQFWIAHFATCPGAQKARRKKR
jgi:hypothetical protein